MKTKFKWLLLAAAMLAVGCAKDDDSSDVKFDNVHRTAENYIAQNAPFFLYNANDLTVPERGFAVKTVEGGSNLKDVVSYAITQEELVYGQLVLDNQYVVSSMKYFKEDEFEEALKEAQKQENGYVLEISTGCMVDAGGSDRFVEGQTISDGAVTIECKKAGTTYYYFVTLNFNLAGATPSSVGTSYGKCISQLPIYYKLRVGGYLDGAAEEVGLGKKEVLKRIDLMRKNMAKEDLELLDGMASGLGKNAEFKPIVYKANLFPDIMRPTACSAFGVMPERSATGKTMAYRTLDWPDGQIPWYARWWYGIDYERRGVISPLQAITKIIYADRTIYQIGLLGIVCGVTEIDATNCNMVAILDAGAKQKYSAEGKYSYVFDLARVLRTETTIDKMAETLTKNPYAFNHLFLMADKSGVQILENNISGKGSSPQRALRRWNSKVGSQFPAWGYDYVIGAVNCFMLEGQIDNYTLDPEPCNATRWPQMLNAVKTILDAKPADQKLLTRNDLVTIQTTSGKFDPAKYNNLYNYNTLQMVQYVPADNKAYIYLKPFSGEPASKPEFIELTL